jgi:F-type H+-transporting ATPase subunit b
MNSFFLASLAQVVDAAPKASEPQLLDLDGTVFVSLALFLLAVLLLTKLLWKPYLRVRDERVTRVDGYREDAKRLESEAAARLAKIEVELGEARRLGSAERARVRAEAQKREQEILALAQAAAQKAVSDARAGVDAALAAERASMSARAEALGRNAAEHVLGRRLAS